jgi:hypothetical protein
MSTRLLTGFVILFLAGCGGPGPTDNVIPTEDNFVDADTAAINLATALNANPQTASVINSFAEEARKDPNVAAVVVNSAGDSAWVVYKSGLECIYDLVSLESRLTFQGTPPLEPSITAKNTGYSQKIIPTAAVDLIPFQPTFPASNKALISNSIGSFIPANLRPKYDITEVVKICLNRLGYVVQHSDNSLEMFERLAEGGLGVIFIEAQGSRHTIKEMIEALSAPSLPSGLSVPNSGPIGSSQVLLTSTQATSENRLKYKDDLKYGRLKIRYPYYIDESGKVISGGAYFGVTVNFVRQHNPGKFVDNTLLVLNAGNMFESEASGWNSEWYSLLKDKCKGLFCVGWEGEPNYSTSAAACANLFELATGANYRYKRRVVETGVIVEPDELKPPMMNLGILESIYALWPLGFPVVDQEKGASLAYQWDWDNVSVGRYLAPAIQDFLLNQAGKGFLSARSINDLVLRIGAGADAPGINLGENDIYPMPGITGAMAGWTCTVPVGLEGPMVIYMPDGRHGAAMKLHRWKPLFKITGTGPDNLAFTVNYAMSARAVIAPRTRANMDPSSVYNKPDNDFFEARFDGGGCVVTWSVSGSYTSGDYKYDYSGNGSKTLTFTDPQGILTATLSSTLSGGTTAVVNVQAGTGLNYTVTTTYLPDKSQTTETRTLPVDDIDISAISVSADMTLQAGSQTMNMTQSGWNGTISWTSAAPSPTFNSAKDRR